MGRKPKINKDVLSEDVCFKCKNGGLLRVCDFKNCLKSYHPECVDKEEDFVSSIDQWTCGWHACFICQKTPKFQCLCCPIAVCGVCLCNAEFVVIKKSYGFCNDCACLVALIERVKTPDPHEEMVDFNNDDTSEGWFKSYWEMIKEKQNLNVKNVRYAMKLLSERRNYNEDLEVYASLSSGVDTEGDFYDPNSDQATAKCKRNKRKRCKKRDHKLREKVFVGWGSQPLLSFLAIIGEDTSQELSRSAVATIISRYCNDHSLFHPEKKEKKVICDSRLQSLFRRKSVSTKSIYNLLSAHYANVGQDEDSPHDEHNSELWQAQDDYGNGEFKSGCTLNRRTKDVSVASECLVKNALERKCLPKEGVPKMAQSCFAAIITHNVELVYLKRSLVEELLIKPETFDEKVIGSIVRVKSDPHDYMQRAAHQLQLVTDVKRSQANGCTSTGVLLQVSNRHQDIAISQLSNDMFLEEECEDLCKRMKDGLLSRLTVVELKQKANALHEDITKHWISTELAKLRKLIDQANEKGWISDTLHGYTDRRSVLETPDHQSLLLQRVPEVIADHAGEFSHEDLSTMAEADHLVTLEPTPTSQRSCIVSLKSSGSVRCMNNEADFPVTDHAETLKPCYKQLGVPEVITDHAGEFAHDVPSTIAVTNHIVTLEPAPTSQRCLVIGLKSSGSLRCMNNEVDFPADKSFFSRKPTSRLVRSDVNCNGRNYRDNSTGDGDEFDKGKMQQTKGLTLDGSGWTAGQASVSDLDTKIAELQESHRVAVEQLQQALEDLQRQAMKEQRRALEKLHRKALEEQKRTINAYMDEWKREWEAKMSQTSQHGAFPNIVPSLPGKEQSKVPTYQEPHQQSDIALGINEAVTQAEDHESNQEAMQSHPETSRKEHPSEQLTILLRRPTNLEVQSKTVEAELNQLMTQRAIPEVILSSDEEVIILTDDEDPDVSTTRSRKKSKNINSCEWYFAGPHGVEGGPYSLSFLKGCDDTMSWGMEVKVWRAHQSPEEAIYLRDAIRQFYEGE